MTSLSVAISTVPDGNMYIPSEPSDSSVIADRSSFLKKNGADIDNSIRVCIGYKGINDFCKYRQVSHLESGLGMKGDGNIADALVTTDHGLTLFLPLADCIGAVLYDPVKQVLMLSHLGRHSLEQNGGKKSVEYLVSRFESEPKDIKVWLTPAASKSAYPLWNMENRGMKEVLIEQLISAKISQSFINDNPSETDKDARYYSHSEYINGRSSDSGRYAIIATMN